MSKKTIFILGCGTMQIPALKIASQMGWTVVGADVNPEAPGRGICELFFPIDLRDVNSLTAAAENIKDRIGLDGVFTTGTDFSVSVASITEELQLPGHSLQAARCATNKLLMRQALKDSNVPCPDFISAGLDDDIADIRIPAPWVVKPVDSMGARGVIRVSRSDNLTVAIRNAKKISSSGCAIVESCIEGPEFSLDALIENGRFIPCGLADRHIEYPPCFIETGHTMPSAVAPVVADTIWDIFEKGVKALGLTHGAAKADIKLGPDGPAVGEIAGRLSGGYMSGWTMPMSSGIEPNRGGLRLAVGLNANLPSALRAEVCAERALIGIEGRIKSLEGKEEALSLPGVKEVFFRFESGNHIKFPTSNMEKPANVLAVGATREEAEQRSLTALRKLRLVLDENCESTGIYLEQNTSFPPDVFTLDKDSSVAQFIQHLWLDFPPNPSRHHEEWRQLILPWEILESNHYFDRENRSMAEVMRILNDENMFHGFSPEGEKIARSKQMAPASIGASEKESDFLKSLIRGGLAGARWFLERQK